MSAPLVCPHCGNPVQVGQTYCGGCGEALPAAILSAGGSEEARAGPEIVGRVCPRCGIAIGAGAPAAPCGACGTPHHLECFAHGGCAVVGCPANPLTPAQAQGAPPVAYAAYPGPPAPSTPTSPWLIAAAVVAGLVTVALIIVVVLLAGGSKSTTTYQSAATPIKPISPISANSGGTPGGAGSGGNAGTLVPPSKPNTFQAPPPLNGARVTGTDAHGYNVGAGCSDNPNSPQPGCADSPSTPSGDPTGACSGGITIDRQTTSCGLAENVKAAYRSDGIVVAVSPERGRSYTFTCQTGGSGTTHMTICHGQAGNAILYLAW